MKRKWHIKIMWHTGINIALCLAAYMLVTAASTQGTTFAWLTTSVAADFLAEARFANIDFDVVRSCSSEPMVYSFTANARAAQVDLIKALNSATNDSEKDTAFSEWLSKYYFTGPGSEYLMPAKAGTPITQYSIIRYDYSFTNQSSVPANFKIEMPRIGGDSIALAAFWSLDDDEDFAAVVYDDIQNVFFVREAIPGEKNFTVSFIAILLTGNSGSLTFAPEFAELIQATNNAVHMVEGWRGIAVDIVPLHRYIRDGD